MIQLQDNINQGSQLAFIKEIKCDFIKSSTVDLVFFFLWYWYKGFIF